MTDRYEKQKVVLDTSVLIQCQEEIQKFIDNDTYKFIVSDIVAKELDNMKECDNKRRKYNGRSGLRFLSKNEESFIYVETKFFELNDDSIIECAFDNNAMIATKDRGMWIKCKVRNIDVLELNQVKENSVNYDGYHIFEWDCSDEYYAKKLEIMANDESVNIFNLEVNEFAVLKDATQPLFDEDGIKDDFHVVSIVQWDGVKNSRIKYKNINNTFVGKVQPRNVQQKMLFSLMQNEDIRIVLASGKYGSGKDFCMLTNALELLQKGKYDKIVWFRNPVIVNGIKEVGFLPGSWNEKNLPFSAILDDILGDSFGTEMFLSNGKLEIGNLGAIRGRTFKNTIMVLTEMQNCSTDIIQLLISRVGEGTKLIINGDFKQIDMGSNGISCVKETIEVLAGQPEFGWVNLEKVERSKIAELASLFDEK